MAKEFFLPFLGPLDLEGVNWQGLSLVKNKVGQLGPAKTCSEHN
jgi:hypothetical protein